MRWWPMAATVAGSAFVLASAGVIMSRSMPWMGAPTRSLFVGSGALFAALAVGSLAMEFLARRVRHDDGGGPLTSVHARKRN